jgi:hypothetical protein
MLHTNILWETITNSEAVFKDQFRRACEICKELLSANKTEVILLDGHGRMVFMILFILYNKSIDINIYTFHVFELKRVVYDWHTMFFPASCSHYNTTIFNYRNRKNFLTFSADCVLYLNFCGISDQLTELIEYIAAAIWTTKVRVFVSFGTRGISKERITRMYEFADNVQKMCEKPHVFSRTSTISGKFVADFVSRRNKFFTYAFFQSNARRI